MRDVWGCNAKTQMFQPTFVEEENGEQRKYWRCPVRYIPHNVAMWIGEYRYHQRFPSAAMPGYGEVSVRWLAAMSVYEEHLAKGREERRKHG
jgi:hypothetical protein